MTNFDKIIKHVLKFEGGYCDIVGDNGGETYCGISRKFNPNWDGWESIDKIKPKHNDIIKELEPFVNRFYWQNYWVKNGIHLINDYSLQFIIFDWVVNSGTVAIKKVQRLVSAKPDGKLGKRTAELINKQPAEHLFNIIKHSRVNFYNEIAKKGINYKFLNGWLNRINNINYEKF